MGGVWVKDTAENPRTSPLFCQTLESIPQSIFASDPSVRVRIYGGFFRPYGVHRHK